VEDGGERQLPGNARAADPWSAGSVGSSRTCEGCGVSGRQQAEAFCRVNRAQPRNRASGVSCTPWLGGEMTIISCLLSEGFPGLSFDLTAVQFQRKVVLNG